MPFYKGTLLFTYTGTPSCGFSESLEFQAAKDADARVIIAAWPAERRKWLAQQWKIVGFRLASLELSGSGGTCKKIYTPVEVGACVTTPIGLLGDADTPFTGVLFRVSFDNLAKKPRMYIGRGVPKTWWTGGKLTIPGDEGNAFLAWFKFVKKDKVGAFKFEKKKALPCPTDMAFWNQYCTVRIASRRIGRPFGLIRGRKSKKKQAP